ncbi:L,D-transpeptidase family protein [Streptomyces sp. S1A]|nr:MULTISPECIES: L,D-transpeptidase family protein [Streptomyces]MCG3043970.1 L,D-transpeptidase family protein [Streptomyces sp. ICN903]MDH2407564.1 L,D-transpeptidase family protein [Streptomyces chitinivorans]
MSWGESTRRGPAGRAALAAAAAVLLGAGCTAQQTDAGARSPAAVTAPPPAPSATRSTPAPDPTPTPTPTPSASEEGERRTPTPPVAPPVSASRPPAPPGTPTASTAPPAPAPMLREGAQGEKVRELQARLRQAGHFDLNPTGYYGPVTTASVSAFQKRRGLTADGQVTRATWNDLTARTRTPTRAELYPPTTRPIADPDPRCLKGRALCISKESRTLAWMIDGKIVSAMDVRFGSELTPTREGEFGVTFKSRDHHSTLYDTPMPYAMFFSGGQAVHYSADFAANGYNGASHGCVNVRDREKIAALFEQVRVGEKVIVY